MPPIEASKLLVNSHFKLTKSVAALVLGLLLFQILLSYSANSFCSASTGSMQWEKRYGGEDTDLAESIIQTSDGGFALVGCLDGHFGFIKTNSNGDQLWNLTYGGKYSYAYSVVQTSDGGYAIAGHIRLESSNNVDFYLVRIDSTGHELWSSTYGDVFDDEAHSLIAISDGGFVLGGTTADSLGLHTDDYLLVKTDSYGNQLWNKTFSGDLLNQLCSLVQTNDGGYALAGYSSVPDYGGYEFRVVKTDSDGNLQWDKTYSCQDSVMAQAIIQSVDGGFVVTGNKGTGDSFIQDIWLIKTDSAGNLLWNKTIGQRYTYEEVTCIIQTTDGGYALAGWKGDNKPSADFLLLKTDSNGNELWNQTFGDDGSQIAYSLVQTTDGGYALLGYTTVNPEAKNVTDFWISDFWLVKAASNPAVSPSSETSSLQNDFALFLPYIAVLTVVIVVVCMVVFFRARHKPADKIS